MCVCRRAHARACDGTGGECRDRPAPTGLLELEAHQLEALLLEALDDVPDQAALHSVGLDHDESALPSGHGDGHAALLLALCSTERRCAAMDPRTIQCSFTEYVEENKKVFTAAALRRGAGCGSKRTSALLIVPAPSTAQMQG